MTKKKIGTIVNTYGLKGEVKITVSSSTAEKRFSVGKKVIIKDEENNDKTFVIKSVLIKNKKIFYVGFEGYDDINQIIWMKNRDVFSNVSAPKGTFFYDDLVDMMVYDSKGDEIGKVENITKMPAGDYIIVDSHYIPFKLDLFIKEVDKRNKTITLTELGDETLA